MASLPKQLVAAVPAQPGVLVPASAPSAKLPPAAVAAHAGTIVNPVPAHAVFFRFKDAPPAIVAKQIQPSFAFLLAVHKRQKVVYFCSAVWAADNAAPAPQLGVEHFSATGAPAKRIFHAAKIA
jgi:hypothetical protein